MSLIDFLLPRVDLPPGPITAFRLAGNYDFTVQVSSPGVFRSSQILETLALDESQTASIRHILTARGTYGGQGARCFSPGLGFTIGSGDQTVDILICLACHWAHFFQGKKRSAKTLSTTGLENLTALYRELFPECGPVSL